MALREQLESLILEMLAKGELREDQTMTVSREAWREWHSKGSRMFLSEGSRPTVHDLLMGIMNVSANDGAVVLAEQAGLLDDPDTP